ncbi:MAG: TrkA C-terminal domain-containing protein [Spirochaetales bacterium]|nr:TrkA C-terminal domain-containing protein [Spirochaetales bacterium]
MIAIISFFIILLVSILIVRAASIMLRLTGLSVEVARFQARSAFTGTGFTTREAEGIINHPVRRKIIQFLMLIGNIGFVSFVSSIILSVTTINAMNLENNMVAVLAIIGTGLLLLVVFTKSSIVEKLFTFIITRALKRWTRIYLNDYDSLLNLSAEFEVTKFTVQEKNWLAGKKIQDLRLNDEGLLVLAVRRTDGYFMGTPKGSTEIYSGDTVILYGREPLLRRIVVRPNGKKGEEEHLQAVDEQNKFEGKHVEKSGEKSNSGIISKMRNLFRRKDKQD